MPLESPASQDVQSHVKAFIENAGIDYQNHLHPRTKSPAVTRSISCPTVLRSKHPPRLELEHKSRLPLHARIMSTYTTQSSRKYYSESPKIIQSRESSSDSRASYDSRASSEQRQYTSSRTSMGYFEGSQSKAAEVPKERKYRDPTADNKYITSTSRGNVEVINHQRRRYDPLEPRASEATYYDYQETSRHSSSKHSSHQHSSR